MEVFHFNDCYIQTMSGTSGTTIDAYAENVAISVKREMFSIKDESGQFVKRFESGRQADMSIATLFATEFSHPDGNNIRLFHVNSSGSVVYQLGSAYVVDRGWQQSENQPVKYDVKILARDFGTV